MSLSLSLSLFLSLFLCLSLSLSLFLSLFRPFLFFPFFFFPSLGYLLYFLFARLGMACSSSASLPSRPLSSTRSRSFLRCLGLLPSETRNLTSPFFLFLVWGFARGDPTWGLSVSFGPPCSVCFLSGSSPGFGARGFFSPEKVVHLAPASVILNVYLAPWLRRCLCFLLFRVTCSLLDGSQVTASRIHSRLISCTRDSSVVLETHQLYSKD